MKYLSLTKKYYSAKGLTAHILLAIALICPPSIAMAKNITNKDVQVAGRTFMFISNIPEGEQHISIIYDKKNAASLKEAKELEAILDKGLTIKKFTLKPNLVDIGDLATSPPRKIVYVTNGITNNFDNIYDFVKTSEGVSFSTDLSCVKMQKCTLGISSSPNVKILISRHVVQSSNIGIAQALTMMATEVD